MTRKTKSDEELADEWLSENNWDYQKYGDKRNDRSAYDTLMKYEISEYIENAFIAGMAAERERSQGLLKALENWLIFEREQVAKFGRYDGERIRGLIADGEKAIEEYKGQPSGNSGTLEHKIQQKITMFAGKLRNIENVHAPDCPACRDAK